MVVILNPEFKKEELEKEIDNLAFKTFIKSIELAGGPRQIIEYRNLTWLPSLMRASYVVVLRDKGYTIDQIAQFLGISETTVKNILSADEKAVLKKLEAKKHEELFNEKLTEEQRAHVAGGLAKLAYEKVKEEKEEDFLIGISQEVCKSLEIPWAVEVLEAIKGTKFPIDKETLKEKLKGLKIKDIPAEEIVEELEYPIRNPADLLHKIKIVLKKKGKE
ncbi:MAG: helix-turn-helix domain-containing protein [Nanoarchaeota archaeon]